MNVVNGQRTFQQVALKASLANEYDGHAEAIVDQETNGKHAMPEFLSQLQCQ